MGIPIGGPTYVYDGDNMSVIHNTQRLESTLKKKSNSIAYHACRESVAMGESLTSHIRTHLNPADLATKVIRGGPSAWPPYMLCYFSRSTRDVKKILIHKTFSSGSWVQIWGVGSTEANTGKVTRSYFLRRLRTKILWLNTSHVCRVELSCCHQCNQGQPWAWNEAAPRQPSKT